MSTRASRAWAVGVILAIWASPLPVEAALTPDQVQQRVFEAQSQFRSGRYDAALDMFREVARLHPPSARDARLQWNMGRCLEELGRFEEALATFGFTAQIAEDDARRARANEKVKTLRASHFGRVRVECPTGARVRIEGLAGDRSCPGEWTIARIGVHRGTVTSIEGRPTPFEVQVMPDSEARITVTPALAAPAAEPPSPIAQPTPTRPPDEPATGADARRQTPSGATDMGPWPLITAGAGVAALGGAIWFAVDGEAAANDAATTQSAARYHELQDRHAKAEVGYYTLAGVGAALVATSAVLFWLDGDETTQVHVGPAAVTGVVRW